MTTAVDFKQSQWQDIKVNQDFNQNESTTNTTQSSYNKFYKITNTSGDHNTTTFKAPIFLLSLEDCTVDKGSEKILEVIVDGDPTPVVKWFKDGNLISTDDIEQLNNCYRVYVVEADEADSGVYSVVATNDHGESKCYARLYVNDTFTSTTSALCPKFIKHFSDLRVLRGENAVFETTIYGNPKPKVQWFFNNNPIHNPRYHYSNVGDTYTLVVSNTCAIDDGKFTIVAENSNGKASCSARLFVSGDVNQYHSDFVTSDSVKSESLNTKKRAMQDHDYRSRHYSLLQDGRSYGKQVHLDDVTYRPLGYSVQRGSNDKSTKRRSRNSLKTKENAKHSLQISSDEDYLYSDTSVQELKRIHEVTRNITEKRYRQQVEVSDDGERSCDYNQEYFKPVELIFGKRHSRRQHQSRNLQDIHRRESSASDLVKGSIHRRRKRQIRLGSVPGEHSKKVLSTDYSTSYQPIDIILNKPKVKKVLIEKQEEVDSKIQTNMEHEQFVELSIPKGRHTSTVVKLPTGKTELSQFCVEGEHETKVLDEAVEVAAEVELKIPKSKHSSKVYKQRKQAPVFHKIDKHSVISGQETVHIHDKPLRIDEEISVTVQKRGGEHSSTIVREKGIDRKVIDMGNIGRIEGKHELRVVEDSLEDFEETDVKIPKPKKIHGEHSSTVVLKEKLDSKDQIVNLRVPQHIPGEDTEKQFQGTVSTEESISVKLPKSESAHSTTVIHQQSKDISSFELEASRYIPGDHEHKIMSVEPDATEVILPKSTGKHTSTVIREKGEKINLGRTRSISGEHSYKLIEDSKNEYSSTVLLEGKMDRSKRYDIKLASDVSEFEEADLEAVEQRQGHAVNWLGDVRKDRYQHLERGRHMTTVVKNQDDSEMIEMILPQPLDTSEIVTQLPDYSDSQSIYLEGPTSLIEREIVHKDVKSEVCANMSTKYAISSDLTSKHEQQSSIKIDSGRAREEIVDVQLASSSAEVVAELKSQYEVKADQIKSLDNKSTVLMEVDSDERYPIVEVQMPTLTVEPSKSVLLADINPALRGPSDVLVAQDKSTSEYIVEPTRKPLYELNLRKPEFEDSTSTILADIKGRLEAQGEVADYVQTEMSSSSVNIDMSDRRTAFQNVQVNIPEIEFSKSCSKVVAQLEAKLDTTDEKAISLSKPKSSYSVCMSNVGEEVSKQQIDLHMRNITVGDSKSEVLVNLPGHRHAEVTGKTVCDSSSSITLDLSSKPMEITMFAPDHQMSSSTLKTQTKHHGLSTAEIKAFGGSSKIDQVELVLHPPERTYKYESFDERRQHQITGGSSTVIKDIGMYDDNAADRYYISDGEFSSSTVQVDVNTLMPKFITELSDVEINVGETLRLICRLSDTDKVVWIKDGAPLEKYCQQDFIDNIIASLTIINISERDKGLYTCIAISGIYQIQSSAYVDVKSKFQQYVNGVILNADQENIYAKQNKFSRSLLQQEVNAQISLNKEIEDKRYEVQTSYTTDETDIVDPFEKFGARRLSRKMSSKPVQSTTSIENSIQDRQTMTIIKSLPSLLNKSEGSFIRLEVITNIEADRVEWTVDGKNINANNKNCRQSKGKNTYSLVLSNVAKEQAGMYNVAVFDHIGNKLNSSCLLNVSEVPKRFQEISNVDNLETYQKPAYTKISPEKSSSLSPLKTVDRELKIRTSKSPKPETRITVRERSAENSVFTFSETEDGEFVSVSTNGL